MKKYFAFFALSALLISCSDDDTQPVQQDEPFFNLAEGNYWVYKRYGVNENTSTENEMGVDSVRVSGQEIIDGTQYYRLEHWQYYEQPGAAYLNEVEYVRVNEQGHLVKPDGFVIHPGYDSSYQYTGPASIGLDVGTLDYSVGTNSIINVEGNSYNVLPYMGYYTPTIEVPEGITCIYYYQPGLGEVFQRVRFIAENTYLEKRLISYHLN